MTPQGEIKTGFQERYRHPVYRRLFLDRLEQLPPAKPNIAKEERSPPEDEKLNNLVLGSQTLLKIKSAIPLNPFPNEVIIDINKVNIIYVNFFLSKHVHSVFIKDISDVIVETSIIFATLKIVDIGYTDNSIDVNYLKRGEAIKARRIIQGLIIAHKNGIDFSKIDPIEIADQVESLGAVEDQA